MKIVVLGASGQLGQHLQKCATAAQTNQWIFLDRSQLDLSSPASVQNLNNIDFSVLVNAAAYTHVEAAEEQKKSCFRINSEALNDLADICLKKKAKLIHYSTDFIFDGMKSTPYQESDEANPLNVYGASKLAGEQALRNSSGLEFLILRTSWVYSEFGKNFYKTIAERGATQDLRVIYDQVGTPTYAGDLAEITCLAIEQGFFPCAPYHYSNEGVASWYDFACAIVQGHKLKAKVTPVLAESYPMKAVRPAFSVMAKESIKRERQVELPHWHDSLARLIIGSKVS